MQQTARALQGRVDTLSDTLSKEHLDCYSSDRIPGRMATCKPDYLAVSCHAGRDKGSHTITDGKTCVTDDADTDWSEVTCCRIAH